MTETRAEKAQRLVDESLVRVYDDRCTHSLAIVQGENDLHTTIVYATGLFFCTCKWGAIHSHTDDLCAHALAVKLAVEKEGAT